MMLYSSLSPLWILTVALYFSSAFILHKPSCVPLSALYYYHHHCSVFLLASHGDGICLSTLNRIHKSKVLVRCRSTLTTSMLPYM